MVLTLNLTYEDLRVNKTDLFPNDPVKSEYQNDKVEYINKASQELIFL